MPTPNLNTIHSNTVNSRTLCHFLQFIKLYCLRLRLRRSRTPPDPKYPLEDTDPVLNNNNDNPYYKIFKTKHRSLPSTIRAILDLERQFRTQMFYSDLQTACESILVEAIFGPGAAVAYPARILDSWEEGLGTDCCRVVEGM
jgi:hypothetical protein